MLKQYAVIVLLGSLFCFTANSQPLVFGSYVPGYPPMMYMQDGRFKGVFPELHRAFSEHLAREPEFMQRSRRHAEQALYSRKADAMALSPEWAQSPEQLVFSNPIIESADYLYSLPNVNWPTAPAAKVCARQDYRYPGIQPLFENGTLVRLDVTSQEAQFRLLEKGRCSFAIMNRFVTHWYLKHQFDYLQIKEHPEHGSVVNFHFAFPATAIVIKDRFNAFLAQYQQSGQLQQLVNRYLHQSDDRNASTSQN
ncbi:hypothetical protein HMF8227_02419 [Saliniradius amylolyticus]|uniref:Solute-binding protein family 3/N-terminal domain-containing protein n=1 Tax=Saliniradius amylolyticus TaxID=2183582 RepID=A0A2S2E5D7_9ALTE|nr:transporter substrate-binding domain-containing protein [Saliniradius amylolyticus]AWL12871.1 hypothetical protein HMF8227_02419 [Saliniradius amylolyticus]